MAKVTIDLAPEQIKEAFEKLPTKEKVRLIEEFEKATRRLRWEALIAKIRARAKKSPISQKEINRVCEEVRQELYEERTKSSS